MTSQLNSLPPTEYKYTKKTGRFTFKKNSPFSSSSSYENKKHNFKK